MAEQKRTICARCETLTKPEKFVPGSFLVEIALWICLLLPGILYSLWRFTNKRMICTACGSDELIPLSSPKGKRIIAQQQQERQHASIHDKSAEDPDVARIQGLTQQHAEA